MAGTTVTIVGNLTADPDFKHTESGHARATLRVACNDGYFDRDKQEWRDREPVFLRVTVWRSLAENVVASVRKGDRVVVVGKLSQFTFEPVEGQRRTLTQLEATSVAVDLSHTIVKIARFSAPSSITTDEGVSVDPETGEIIEPDDELDLDESSEELAEAVPF